MRVSVTHRYKFLLVFTLETLVLSSLTIVVIQVGSAAPQSTSYGIALDNITIVAVHPFNWIETNREYFWRNIVNKLHIQFIDRATGFMEGADWFKPRIDMRTIAYAKSRDILTGSYMILTPIP
ncbi:MAG: hypothetical protein QW096_08605, partial [Thermofilaceae archaeon]